MPDPILATPAAANANSYTTLVEATAYNDNFAWGAAWATATSDAQTRALITATRLIDEHYRFSGAPTTLAQALEWPRAGMVLHRTTPIGDYEIPARLKQATAELARLLLAGDRTVDNDADAQGIERLKAGPIEIAFRAGVGAKVIPDAVAAMLQEWGFQESSRGVRFLIRA